MANSAKALVKSFLGRYGLGDLADWAWRKYQRGDSLEEILVEARGTRTYKNRFPAMEQLAKEGRAISEEAYMAYEAGLRSLVVQHGLPINLYTGPKYTASLLLKGVSLAEVQRRTEMASAAALTVPTEVRSAAKRLYGISSGQWTSMWLDPDRTLPDMEKKFAAATIAGEAAIADFDSLSRKAAERLVEAGVSREQARQGIGTLSRELIGKLPGEVESALGVDRAVTGAVGVGDEAAALRRRRQQRTATFAGGGGAVTTQEGAALGTTRR